MDSKILIVSRKSGFMADALQANLKKAGFITIQAEPEVQSIEAGKEDVDLGIHRAGEGRERSLVGGGDLLVQGAQIKPAPQQKQANRDQEDDQIGDQHRAEDAAFSLGVDLLHGAAPSPRINKKHASL